MKQILTILFIVLITVTIYSADSEVYFASDPALSPDGQSIVFSFEGDLWNVSSAGGNAYRLTGMDGREIDPVYSPDGKWIAFSGNQDGNFNVYVIPVNGGDIKQLTYNDASDEVSSWSWDSENIYFKSNRYNRMNTYKVSVNGGTPVKLFDNYFSWPHNFIVNPVTGDYLFNESWESSVFTNRKRYKGAFNPDIKSYNPKTKEFKKLTTYNGKDMWPSVDLKGNIYFVSDRANNEYNLYTFAEGKPEQLTSFKTSVIKPKVSADGRYVVFEKDYQIYLYDAATKKSEKVKIFLPVNRTLATEQSFNVKGKITNFNVSPDGRKIAFASRGELFVSDIDGKFVKHLNTLPEGRVMEVMWIDSADVIFNQTVNGWLNWFTIKADGSGKEQQITDDQRTNRQMVLNSDRTKGAYYSGRNELRMIDLKTFKSETIVKDEFWAFNNSAPYFSPDDKYIVFAAMRNFEEDLFIYNTQTKSAVNITNTGVTEIDPFWSPDGKYLYFSSDRYQPSYPYGVDNAKIYRIKLENFDKDFKSSEFDKLFAKDEKKDTGKPVVKINFNNMKDRWDQVTNKRGNQSNPYVIMNKDKTEILYISNQDGEGSCIWKTTLKPFEKPETEKIKDAKTGGLQISKGKKKYYVLVGGNIGELDLDGNKVKKISISCDFNKNLRSEFDQMFYEVWASLDENYYDPNFHGVDWKEMENQFEAFLPHIHSRENLRTLLNDMLGELNSSHQGFYSSGNEEKTFYKIQSLATGIMFDEKSPFTVDYIVKNSPADKEEISVKKGDELIAVNGNTVDKNKNREMYFTNPSSEEEIVLTFSRDGKKYDVKIHPASTGAVNNLLYDEWIDRNQKYVDEKSDKKIAYVYMKNMGGGAFDKFYIDMTTEAFHRDGLILDLRYNTGGNVHDKVLEFLRQKPYLKWRYRNGKFTVQPNFTPSAKPIVLLVNFQTLSDAEMTSTGFKQLGLGKIIGTETYRWIIFTSGKSLVDGSFVRLPSWGCYTLDGKDIEMNGVKPDIFVETTFKDRIEGKDPQLEKAIEEVKAEMK